MGGSAERLGELVESLLSTRASKRAGSARSEVFDLRGLRAWRSKRSGSQAERKQPHAGTARAGSCSAHARQRSASCPPGAVNLLVNAIKFTDAGGIEVVVERACGTQRLRVRDTGPGIRRRGPGAHLRALRAGAAMRDKSDPGVGLGLALVREMTRALGGLIQVSSTVGEGSTFQVILPSGSSEPSRSKAR